jgi:acetate kinase
VQLLTVNAGSSSLKLSVVGGEDRVLFERRLDAPDARIDAATLRRALGVDLPAVDAVAHRIVHGGERFRSAVVIDEAVAAALHDLTGLAPLHQPAALAALRAVTELMPDTPAVACFDTAFHATLPAEAATVALPAPLRERWGLRRYGFHGLSHAWVARRAPELLGARAARVVSCHLGAGASLCAIRDGRSVDTTMGFTPLEGLVMATRSGSVDPGMLLWLLERETVDPRELARQLEHRSGLLGLSGSSDMAEVLARADAGAPDAVLALDVYVHSLCAHVAAMAAALGGMDVLAFTGGVGEHAPAVRARTAERLSFLGVAIDPQENRDGPADREITASGSAVRTVVVRAREDIEMAHQARGLLTSR